MKKISITFVAISSLILLSCSNADKTNETPATHDSVATTAPEVKKEMPPMDSAAQAKAWEAYMMPGEMHKWMASMDGKWSGESTFWEGPEAQPMPGGTSTMENKMILGGRYQQSVYKGKMMGMDFEGMGMMAFDNGKKKFVNTWSDNMGTGIMVMEGTYDETSKAITLTGKMYDPSTAQDCEMRQVLKMIDDKHQVMEMYVTKDGKEFKNMEIKLSKI